jgi:lipopolysaccharide export system ATP-binding protein
MSSADSLQAEGLQKSYRGRRVVDGVSFSVSPGEVVGLLGPNGAGKTTSFNMVVGLVRPDAGTVRLAGHDLSSAPLYRRARAGLGYLPQESSVFRKLSVIDNLRAVLELRSELKAADREKRALALLEELEISSLAASLGEQLSGGERRRLEIARCLAMEPKIVLLDEPFAGIDPIAVADLQTLIAGLSSRGLGVLITDHNVRETLSICDRAYLLVLGKVVEEGSRSVIAGSEIARKVYLGDGFSLPEPLAKKP